MSIYKQKRLQALPSPNKDNESEEATVRVAMQSLHAGEHVSHELFYACALPGCVECVRMEMKKLDIRNPNPMRGVRRWAARAPRS